LSQDIVFIEKIPRQNKFYTAQTVKRSNRQVFSGLANIRGESDAVLSTVNLFVLSALKTNCETDFDSVQHFYGTCGHGR